MPIMNEHSLTMMDVVIRMVLAVVCGGVIGIERAQKRRPAGSRTHMLICLGACMTTMTSQYLLLNRGLYTDPARLGAQVIAGIGFIGAGTIIVTKRRQIKGLTTAAGLWASAIVGLCCGAGFFLGAGAAAILILVAEMLMSKLEWYLISSARVVNIFVEYRETETLTQIVDTLKGMNVSILDMELNRPHGKNQGVTFSLGTVRRMRHDTIMNELMALRGVIVVEEL